MEKSKEIVKEVGTSKMDPELNGLFDLNNNLEGVDIRFPQIQIMHQSEMFKMPSGEMVKDFIGIILDMNNANAYWEKTISEIGLGLPPDCFSLDGLVPSQDSEKIQIESDRGGCKACPRNQFKSDGKRGKACKNMKRVHILIGDELLPYRLTIPPTGLAAINDYVVFCRSKPVPYQLAYTKFSVISEKNKDGIQYSKVIYSFFSYVEKKRGIIVKKQYEEMKNFLRGQMIMASEYV